MALPVVLQKTSVRHLLTGAIFLWVSCCIGYWAVTKYDIYDPASGGRDGDAGYYIRMSQGASPDEIPKPWRYRVVVPFLAGHVPDSLPGLDIYYSLTEEKRIAFQFGVVNVLGMATAAYFLFLLCAAAGFTFSEAFLAGFLYLTSFYIINFTAIPRVDSWAYATLIAGILCVQKRQYAVLIGLSLIAVFVKETIFLVVIYSLVIPEQLREKIRATACMLPALIAYVYFRLVMYPTEVGVDQTVGTFAGNLVSQLEQGYTRLAVIIIEGGQTFGILWVFLIIYVLYFRSANCFVTKSLILIPVVLIVPFLINLDVGRVWFFAFPAIIPAAALAISRIFEGFSAFKARLDQT
jgi:hypothetical protein